MLLDKFNKFLQSIDLNTYREKYRPIKIVEMDMPKNAQAVNALYKVYWDQKKFLSFEDFYQEYLKEQEMEIESFRKKTTMCKSCFYRGLPARIYRTWASIITQIHAGYVAESVFGKGSVSMSESLDHQGADFQVNYRKRLLNYQVKKESFSSEVRRGKGGAKKKIEGEFVDIFYNVPASSVFDDPKTKKGEWRKPYKDFMENEDLKRLDNGFIVFTPYVFEKKKEEVDKLK